MKLTNEEIGVLEDVTGNTSVALEGVRRQVKEEISVELLLDIIEIAQRLQLTATEILRTHKPFTYGRKYEN